MSEVAFALTSSVKMLVRNLSGYFMRSVRYCLCLCPLILCPSGIYSVCKNLMTLQDSQRPSHLYEMCVSEQDTYGLGFSFSLKMTGKICNSQGHSEHPARQGEFLCSQQILLDNQHFLLLSCISLRKFIKMEHNKKFVCREFPGLEQGICAPSIFTSREGGGRNTVTDVLFSSRGGRLFSLVLLNRHDLTNRTSVQQSQYCQFFSWPHYPHGLRVLTVIPLSSI